MPALFPRFLDALDERRARRFRQRLGREGKLISWRAVDGDGGGWMARFSGPAWPSTIERTGATRSRAIRRAELAFDRCVAYSAPRASTPKR